MVVKSATKKKLMDIGFPHAWAHKMSNDAKWDDILNMNKEELTNKVLSDVGWTSTWTTGIKFSKEDELLWEELVVNALNMYKITECLRFHGFYDFRKLSEVLLMHSVFSVTWQESEVERLCILFNRLQFLKGHWGKRATEDWEYCNGMTKNEFLIGYNQLKEVAHTICKFGMNCKLRCNLYTDRYNTKSPIIKWPVRNPMEVKE